MKRTDCYEFYLWSIGAITLSPKKAFELIDENQEGADDQ